HPLGREIVATELANTLVDEMGATFVQRVTRDTGTTVAEAARAWTIAWAVAGGATLARAIADGGFALEVETTCRLVLERTAERVTKWMLANTDPARPAAEAGEDDRWQEQAVEGLFEDVLRARRRLARLALEGPDAAAAARSLGKVQDLIRDLRAAPRTSLAALQVVVRELRRAAERE